MTTSPMLSRRTTSTRRTWGQPSGDTHCLPCEKSPRLAQDGLHGHGDRAAAGGAGRVGTGAGTMTESAMQVAVERGPATRVGGAEDDDAGHPEGVGKVR